MTSILVLASDLGISDAARQLALILPALPRDQFRVEIGVLGDVGPAEELLRESGFTIHRVPIRHILDFSGMRNFRRCVDTFHSSVIHAVGPSAARASLLIRGPRLIVSDCSVLNRDLPDWFSARQVRKADRILVHSRAEATAYGKRGVAYDRLMRLPLATAPSPPTPKESEFRRSLGVPDHARLIFAAGRFDRASGLKDAVWAFDVLKYESPDLYLVLIGDGPERQRLEAFGKALGFDDYRVRFAGERPDAPSLLTLAQAVWVTHEHGGEAIALDGMAAGKPVLGWNTDELTEVIRDGETGLLVTRRDRVGLASKTRALLDDPALAARLGETGRQIAAQHTPERAAAQLAMAYAG